MERGVARSTEFARCLRPATTSSFFSGGRSADADVTSPRRRCRRINQDYTPACAHPARAITMPPAAAAAPRDAFPWQRRETIRILI